MEVLTLAQADRVVDVALAEGGARGFAPLCAVVLDPVRRRARCLTPCAHRGGHALPLGDLLIVDGDPTVDVSILQDRQRIVAVVPDGSFHHAVPLHTIGHTIGGVR
jgi:hypothetical protein